MKLAAALVAMVVLAAGATAAAEPSPPNVLLIVTDDQGYGDLGAHGNTVLRTPVLDQLCKESVTFSRFYVSPVCAPTRASLMTGRHYLRTGVYNTRFGGDTLDESELTLPQALKRTGYRTGLFGKWHLGTQARHQPQHRGFDEFFGFLHGHIEHYDYPTQLMHNGEPVAARGYLTDLFTDAAINFIASSGRDAGGAEQPFFCYVAYNVPHTPLIVGNAHAQDAEGENLLGHYLAQGVPLRVARIYTMIERADAAIGRLLRAVDDAGLRERTLVLFMCDNGGIHREYTAGLRGSKASVYEGGVRSPLIVRLPGRFKAGMKLDAIASAIDLMPTICELAGVTLPIEGGQPLDGRSLVPLLTGDAGDSPHLYVYHTWNRFTPDVDKNWAIANQRWKLANGALYDLHRDPGEKEDLSSQEPQRVMQMRREYERWFSDVTAGRQFQPRAIEVGGEFGGNVELQTSWAQLSGDLKYEFRAYDWDTIEAWPPPRSPETGTPADAGAPADGPRATWRLDVKEPGRYAIEVSYSYASVLPPAPPQLRLAVAGQSLSLQPRRTPTRDVFITGVPQPRVVQLSAGQAVLEARVSGEAAGAFALNRIWIRRLED